MEKYNSREFYNPNAIYEEGLRVKKDVEKYRAQIAKGLGAAKESVIFTSGGTASNVLAVRGVKPGKIIVEPGSHPSVFEAVIENNSKETTLVSSVTTDNKLGRQIRGKRKKNNSQYPLLHIDASQTALYFNVGLEALACDILTLDSAKIYGPKGCGALVVRRSALITLPPLGTPAVPLIAGFAKAFEIATRDRERESKRLESLSTRFAKNVESSLPQAQIEKVSPNIINVSISGILPELLVLALDREGLLVSAGPACNSNKPEPPETPIRISLGRGTTEKEIKEAAEIFCHVARNVIKSNYAAV